MRLIIAWSLTTKKKKIPRWLYPDDDHKDDADDDDDDDNVDIMTLR